VQIRHSGWAGLVLGLAAVTSAQALEPGVKLFIETPLRPIFHGVTNLPDGSDLMLTLSRPESGYMAQAKMKVMDGHFVTERFSAGGNPLNPEKYRVEVSMSMAELQPKQVQTVIGEHGQRLTGNLIKPSPFGGPMLEYVTDTQLGGPPDATLDANAKAISAAELQRWAVESCAETVDIVNAGVRNGTLQGREVSSANRKQKIDECIAEVNRPTAK
jgi:hypothetical protein